MKTEKKKCPCCNANLTIHSQRISKGLATSLIKFKKEVIKRNRNKIHSKDEVPFTKSEYNNFQKLRYHGLIAKYMNSETDEHEAGYWLLTKRGNQFVKNELLIPQVVYTFRNKIVRKHEKLVSISQVLKDDNLPYWDEIGNYTGEYADIYEIEEVKFDNNGQGLMF